MKSVVAKMATQQAAETGGELGSDTEEAYTKERVTVRLPTKLYCRLDELRGVTHASNISEVLKNALLFYDALVRERQRGNEVYVISSDGERTKYPVFYD